LCGIQLATVRPSLLLTERGDQEDFLSWYGQDVVRLPPHVAEKAGHEHGGRFIVRRYFNNLEYLCEYEKTV